MTLFEIAGKLYCTDYGICCIQYIDIVYLLLKWPLEKVSRTVAPVQRYTMAGLFLHVSHYAKKTLRGALQAVNQNKCIPKLYAM